MIIMLRSKFGRRAALSLVTRMVNNKHHIKNQVSLGGIRVPKFVILGGMESISVSASRKMEMRDARCEMSAFHHADDATKTI